MKKMFGLFAFLVFAPMASAAADGHDEAIARFDGGIGVQPVLISAATLTATPNVVRGIGPGLLPWTIRGLKARLDDNGELAVRGRGLVIAGGFPIGTRGDLSAVRALLFCGTSTTAFVSQPGALDLDGDFKIDGTLTPDPGTDCPTPTLLIAVGLGTPTVPFRWIAAGVVDHREQP